MLTVYLGLFYIYNSITYFFIGTKRTQEFVDQFLHYIETNFVAMSDPLDQRIQDRARSSPAGLPALGETWRS